MDDPRQHTHDHPPPGAGCGGGPQECLACPICVLLQALQIASPEALQHLVAAGRELTLALQAVVSAREQPDGGGGPARVQRIRVD